MAIDGVLNLASARKHAKGLLGAVAKGGDPLTERRRAEAATGNTLRAVVAEYLAREAGRLRGLPSRRSILERLVLPKLGGQHIAEIRRSDIVRLLDRIEDERGPSMADMTLAVLRRVLNWHAGRSDDFRSPITRGMGRIKPRDRARERILSDEELRAVWRAAEARTDAFGYLVRFCLLTGARRTEVARMTRGEIEGTDWLIPAARYKSKRDHLVPLSAAARALLAETPQIGESAYVFTTDGSRPISGFSKFKRGFDNASGVTSWTIHDLRRSARSLMSRAGVNADIAERCLGHVISGVRGTYDRHAYRHEKAAAFETLAALIERIVHPQENILSMQVRAS
jgi:integrase